MARQFWQLQVEKWPGNFGSSEALRAQAETWLIVCALVGGRKEMIYNARSPVALSAPMCCLGDVWSHDVG